MFKVILIQKAVISDDFNGWWATVEDGKLREISVPHLLHEGPTVSLTAQYLTDFAAFLCAVAEEMQKQAEKR